MESMLNKVWSLGLLLDFIKVALCWADARFSTVYTTAGCLVSLLRVKGPADVPSRITMNRDPCGDSMEVRDIPVPIKKIAMISVMKKHK
jgi:hypothetical protein